MRVRITVHEETDKVYEMEVESEEASWDLDPVEFSEDDMVEDRGGDTSISDVQVVE